MQRLFVALTSALLCGVAIAACGGSSPSPATPTPIGTIFPARPLSQLTMCVDTVEATRAHQAEAVGRIRVAMTQVMEHEIFALAYPSAKAPVIDDGCPSPPALYDPEARFNTQLRSIGDVRGRSVGSPGFYRETVFVIEDDEIERFFSGYSLRLTTEEYVCEGDACFPRTQGLYVGPADLEDTAFLVDTLEKHLGLERIRDPIQPGYHP